MFVGKDISIQKLLPQAEVIYLHYGKDNLEEYNARIDMKQPIITILDRLTEKIENENKIRTVYTCYGLKQIVVFQFAPEIDRKSTRLNSSHSV